MNKTLASAALRALTAKGFEDEKGYCQRWVRQVIQSSPLGHEYDGYFKESAKATAQAFLNSQFAFTSAHIKGEGGLQEGDILYKTEGSGGFGHVGILTAKGVAENSSYHARTDSDARGLRTLAQFGAFQVVVRLPDPAAAAKPAEIEDKLVLDGKTYDFTMLNNEVYISIRDALALAGREVKEFNNQIEEKHRFYVNSKPKVTVK